MPINFIPNDPLAVSAPPMRQQATRPDRPASRAGLTFTGAAPENRYIPGTPEFLFWQCREAALMTIEMWENLNGNLIEWARSSPNPKKLSLFQNNGIDLNAYYDGDSLAFFEYTTGSKTTFSGASTDIVAHEVGHALLDAIRPDLWSSNFTESNAFHEAFGDCIAILTALFDRESRVALLAVAPNLDTPNFVEATAEDLSDGARLELGVNHPAAAPRHALNDFLWQLPTTLPSSGPPAVLSSEIHSFGRLFSGCFYDLVRNIFTSMPNRDESALLVAAQIAGKLLIEGAKSAPDTPRFFQAVGRAMLAADQNINGGVNRTAIRSAFSRHNIALGSAAILTPRATLAGSAPKFDASAKRAILSAATRKDIKLRIDADVNAKLVVNSIEIDGEEVAEAINFRNVSLSGLSEKLNGVVAIAAEPVLITGIAGKAALVADLPESYTTTDEVRKFVAGLLKNSQISFGTKKQAVKTQRSGAIPASGKSAAAADLPTHVVRTRRGKKVLERVRFVCRHCRQ